MLPVRRIVSPKIPELATATYSNALSLGSEIVLSGMTAHPQAGQSPRPLTTYEQSVIVLHNLLAYVEAGGGNINNIYKLVIYLTNMADIGEVGRARREFFKSTFPCATLLEVKSLALPELRVEIDAWARLDIDLSRCI